MNEFIVDLARRIASDVSMLEGVSVDLVEVKQGDLQNPLFDSVEDDYLRTQMSPSIAVSIDGSRCINLQFFKSLELGSLLEQFLEQLNQLQDVIVEHLLKAWPACPEHPHVLVLEIGGQDLWWRCPVDSKIEVLVSAISDSTVGVAPVRRVGGLMSHIPEHV